MGQSDLEISNKNESAVERGGRHVFVDVNEIQTVDLFGVACLTSCHNSCRALPSTARRRATDATEPRTHRKVSHRQLCCARARIIQTDDGHTCQQRRARGTCVHVHPSMSIRRVRHLCTHAQQNRQTTHCTVTNHSQWMYRLTYIDLRIRSSAVRSHYRSIDHPVR